MVLIWGREDTYTPLDQAHELVGLKNGADLIILEGVGHIPQIEAPGVFQTTLLEALIGIKEQIMKKVDI